MRKRIALGFIVGLLIMSMIACSNSPSSETTGPSETGQKELVKITVSEPIRSELWGPVYLAKSLGFFEAEGLDVNFITVQNDMPTAPVLAGDAQFGLYGPEMILSFNAKGQGTKLIATASDRYPYSFVSTKDITDIKQLKGQVVNAADSGSSPRAFVRSIVASAGLNPDQDVTYVNIPGSASVAAVVNNEIKGTYVTPTARALALSAGLNLLVNTYDPEVHTKLIGSESYEMYIVFSTDKYIKDNPEIVQAFANAVYRGVRWADSHSVDEIVAALQPLFTNSDTLSTAVAEIKENGLWSADAQFSDSGYAAINRVAIASGLIKEPIDRSAVIADEFILKAKENMSN
jgi:NitT/TauT family transport system substrate-binding protein